MEDARGLYARPSPGEGFTARRMGISGDLKLMSVIEQLMLHSPAGAARPLVVHQSPTYRNEAPSAPPGPEGGCKAMRKSYQVWLPVFLVCLLTVAASAQSFQVQCPTTTITHPTAAK